MAPGTPGTRVRVGARNEEGDELPWPFAHRGEDPERGGHPLAITARDPTVFPAPLPPRPEGEDLKAWRAGVTGPYDRGPGTGPPPAALAAVAAPPAPGPTPWLSPGRE